MKINFLPFKHYQIYQAKVDGWFLLRWEHHPADYSWQFKLTPKQIVYELFRITGGSLGYYLVNLKTKNYHYCGTSEDHIKTILEGEGGLIKQKFVSTARANIPRILEEFVDITEDLTDRVLVYELCNDTFLPFDTCSRFSGIRDEVAKDLGISKKELHKRFLDINRGKPGFYIYKAGIDQVLYAPTAQLMRQVIASLTPT